MLDILNLTHIFPQIRYTTFKNKFLPIRNIQNAVRYIRQVQLITKHRTGIRTGLHIISHCIHGKCSCISNRHTNRPTFIFRRRFLFGRQMQFVSTGRTVYLALLFFRSWRRVWWSDIVSIRLFCEHFSVFFLYLCTHFRYILFCFQMLCHKSLTKAFLFNHSSDNRLRFFSLHIRLCRFRQHIRYSR